jgi:glycosyltransferase involved in cell wall biosynthesis
MPKQNNKGVLIYSGNSWNGIWSQGHELATHLAKHVKTVYLNVPTCQAPDHPNLNNNANYPAPKNLLVVSSKKTFENFSLSYLIYTQLYTILSFFKIKDKTDSFLLYNVFDLPFFLLAKIFGKKVYFMYVDDYIALAKTSFFKRLAAVGTSIFFALSDGVFCTARVLEQEAKKHGKKVVYTPNCVNLADVKNLKKKTTKKFIIGFIGTIGHWVDTKSMIDVANAFKKDKNIEIWIVGGGEGLETLKKAKLSNAKLFGFIPHKKMYSIMSQFDVAFIPFHINKITNAVSPIKLFEYWLAKKPVVCSKTTELAGFKDAVLFANNGEELIKQVKLLKQNPKLRKELAENGNALVKKEYNWNVMIEKYLEVL